MEQRPWLVFFKTSAKKVHTKETTSYLLQKSIQSTTTACVCFCKTIQNIKLCKMHFICTEFFFDCRVHIFSIDCFGFCFCFSKIINFVFRKRQQYFNILQSWFSLCSVKALKSTPVLVFCVYSVSCQAGGSLGGRHRAVQNLCAAHWAPLSCRGAYNERKQL